MMPIYFTTSSSLPDKNAYLDKDGKPITVDIQNDHKKSPVRNGRENNNADASYLSNGSHHSSAIQLKSNGMCD